MRRHTVRDDGSLWTLFLKLSERFAFISLFVGLILYVGLVFYPEALSPLESFHPVVSYILIRLLVSLAFALGVAGLSHNLFSASGIQFSSATNEAVGTLAPALTVFLATWFFLPAQSLPTAWITNENLPPDLKTALRELSDGKILFNPPKEMLQGKTERVEARISYGDIGNTLADKLKGKGTPEIEDIKVGRKMSVYLYANKDEFEITKYSSDSQVVGGSPYTQWEWDVKPLAHGDNLQLHLKAVINLERPGKAEAPIDLPVIDKQINVKVNHTYIAEQIARDEKMRTLLIGGGSLVTLLTGIAAFIKRRRDKREAERKAQPRKWETP